MATKADRERIEKLIAPYRVDDPRRFRLADRDPGATDGVKHKAAAHTRAAVRKNIRDIVLDFEPFGEGSRQENACVADVAGACAL